MEYNLITLDPERIIARQKTIENLDEAGVVITTDQYKENALLRQLLIALKEKNNDLEVNEDIFLRQLFFVDFSDLFKYKKELQEKFDFESFEKEVNGGSIEDYSYETDWNRKLFLFFRNGFEVRYEGEEQARHYVPFESSASMSRTCRITFIDEKIKDAVEDRLMLGMDLTRGEEDRSKQIHVARHKFYAYRGLYMTDGTPVEETDDFQLNEETVIVLPDAKYKFSQSVPTISAREESDYWNIVEGEEQLTVKPFDGEGIICPEYAEELNRQLFGKEEAATSFQIRLPFIKGMLHKVDFARFLREECGIGFENEYMVEDCYHILRDLRKAKLILTKSMLKNHDWLEKYCDREDPLKIFFERMHAYEHRLYVVRTDLNLHNEEKKIKLNYQSLNTLDMDRDSFEKKVKETVEEIRRVETNPDLQREFVLGNTEAFHSGWKYALSRNIDFLNEPYVKERIREEIDSRIRDIYRGSIRVTGENRFLSGDLMAFMIHVLKCADRKEDAVIHALKNDCIKSNSFVMPSPRIKVADGKTYGFLRNPHLSRNEECVLNLTTHDMYDKYFGHLSGVLMTAYTSLAPMTLGGADFDGDMVKMIADVDIIKAMRRGKRKSGKIVNIPSSNEKPLPVPEAIDYAHVKDTFGNQVGRVSNLAIRLGEKVYSEDYVRRDEDGTHSYIPADCTLLTGLEIDSAKNGKHPRKNIEELSKQVGEVRSDYISILKELKEIEKADVGKRDTKKSVRAAGVNGECRIFYKQGKEEKSLSIPAVSDGAANIELLPSLYVRTMYGERGSIPKGKDRTLFAFEGTARGENDRIRSGIKAVVDVYNLYIRSYYKLRQKEESLGRANWYGKALLTMKKQYYGRPDLEEKLSALAAAECILESTILDEEKLCEYGGKVTSRCEALVLRLQETEWIFEAKDKRPDTLRKILPPDEFAPLYMDDGVMDILTNFDASGYMLLYYLIKSVEQSNVSVMERICDEPDSNVYSGMYQTAHEALREVYKQAVRRRYSYTKLKRKLREKIVKEWMPGELTACYAAEIYSVSGKFFWEIFDGRQGVELLRQNGIVFENIPYKKWSNENLGIETEKYDEEEEYADVR